MKLSINKYHLMTFTAFILALFSSIMTALGMSDLFEKGGIIIFLIFMCIDLGRFLLFNFLTDEWKNLRKIKYVITVILTLLFGYSAVGIFSQLSNMISPATRQAMLNAATYNKAAANALVKQTRTSDMTTVAKKEYEEALSWNKTDYTNCLKRAQTKETQEEIDQAENKCNNTKRWLDNKASKAYKEAINKADESLDKVETTTKEISKNQSDLAAILTSICEISRMDCGSYNGLQNALSIIILLVIVGTDYLQIAIVLAVNTRKNKKVDTEPTDPDPTPSGSTPKSTKKKKEAKAKLKVIKKKTKPTKNTTTKQVLSKEASIKLAKKLEKKPKTNKALKKAMKEYEEAAKKENDVKSTKRSKKLVKSKAKLRQNTTIPKKEEFIPIEKAIEVVKEAVKKKVTTKKPKKVIEKLAIEMSEAQQKAINKLKKKINKTKLEGAFIAAKEDIKKDSKINTHKPVPFTSETDFLD